MEQKMAKVTVNGETKEYPCGTSYRDIVDEYQKDTEFPIILVTADGRLRELHKKVKRDCTVRFVTIRDHIGFSTYKRSACLVLLKAIYDVAGKETVEKVEIHYSVGSGYYFTINGFPGLNQGFLDQIREEMHRIADACLPIGKKSVSTADAIALFHQHHMYDKEKLFRYRRVSRVNIYNIENYEDYFYGYMADHTGYVKYFDLKLYDEGFVLELPERSDPFTIPPFAPDEKIFKVQKESQEWAEKMDISYVGDLNDRITREGVGNILLVQEALQEARISRIAEQIVADGSRKFIMIAGPSSSGKTSFSHRLSIQLTAHGMKPHPIAVDNYFKNREDTPLDEYGERNYECLEALDVEKFNEDMLALLRGERIELPVFNFVTGHREYRGDFLKLGKEDVLVIEGIHGLNDKLSHSLPKESKFKIYISALTQLNIDKHNRIPTTDGRLIRRIVRDARTRGTSAKDTIARWPSVRRGEEANIFPYQEEADVMFNSALVYELACLKLYAEPLLFGIGKDEPEYIEAKRFLKFFDYFVAVPSDDIPRNSLLREFVGGAVLMYDSFSAHLMPLINSSFAPGQAQATVDAFQDPDQRQIAQAELYYFSGRAQECRNIAELYLQDKDLCLRLSAGLLYSFSNLTLGNPSASRMGFRNIQECLRLAEENSASEEVMASCVFAGYLATVLMHLPADGLPPLKDFLPYLPAGIRAYAIYILAHNAYLNEEYERALGLCQSVFLMLDGCYPIAMEYLYCVIIMCLNNQKKHEEAREILMKAWNMAKPDGFLEPFIEHHGLMLGQIEACIKPTEPENYKRLSQAVIAFSRGWMDIHNPQLQSSVTDKLTPMEFSIAMLASKGWTNREIADHLSMSVNTIKHYLSRIFQTLGVEKREELKPFVNK